MSQPKVSFLRAVYALFFISLVRFKPAARVWAINLVAANTCGLFFLPRTEPVVLWISIVVGLIFMGQVYRHRGFVRLLGTGHALWLIVVPWLAWRALHLPAETSSLFRWWLVWVVVTDAVSLALDALDLVAYLKGDREPYYS